MSYRTQVLVVALGSFMMYGQAQANTITPVSGSDLWLDAAESSTITQSSGLISQWSDRSGNGRHATQSTGINKPLYLTNVQNGQGAVSFDGDATNVTTPDFLSATYQVPGSHTVFVVFNAPNNDSGQPGYGPLVNSGGTDHPFQLRVTRNFAGDNLEYYLDSGIAIPQARATDNSTQVASVQRIIGDQALLSLDGNVATGPAGTAVATSSLLMIGYRGDHPITAFKGNMNEIIAYGSSLNNAQRVITENYLSSKWNTSLVAAGERYTGDTTAKGDYDFNVSGIGAEADGNVSNSNMQRGLLVSELNSSLAAGDYLLAGDKGQVTNSVVSSGGFSRWNRVWYLEKTNSVDARLTFDLSDGNASLASSNYVLLYSASSSLAFSQLSATFSVSGDQISFDVLDGQLLNGYYTLGVTGAVPEPSSIGLLLVGGLYVARMARNRKRG